MTYLLTKEARWYRVAVFAVLFMLIPSLMQSSWDGYWKHYYRTQPISTFYEALAFEADNVCVGDNTQHVETVRLVKGTETGWAADIVRELYVIPDGTTVEGRSKVFDESADIFIEVIPDGFNEREAALPELAEGVYQWDIVIIRLYLPYDVVRIESPQLTSNLFAVEDCGGNK